MGDFMVPVSQNEQSGEIINTNPSQTGHTTLPLPTLGQHSQNQYQSQIRCDNDQPQSGTGGQIQQTNQQPIQQQQQTRDQQPQQQTYVSQSNMQPTQIQQTQQSVASNQNHIKQEPIHQKPSNLVTAQRVAEILKAAGETFCRLGECTMMLDQSANPNKTKWYDTDVTDLAQTVEKFKEDLGRLSATMQQRTTQKLQENMKKQAMRQKMSNQPRQVMTNIQSPGIRQIPNQTTIKREIPLQSQGQGQPDKRPRLQQQRPNQSGAPIQQQQQQNYQNKPTGVRPQQQQRNQNGQQIPIAKNQRSPVPIQRGQQPQQQNNQQPYTFQQQNTSGQRIVQVTQQQVNTSNSISVPIQNQQIQQVSQPGQNIINQQSVQVRQVHVGNNQIGGTTRLVMGSDQNGPKYTVQETVIDGKKTLILDHNDLARLLQSNNGNAVVLHQGPDGQVQQGPNQQIVTVMQPSHQSQNQSH